MRYENLHKRVKTPKTRLSADQLGTRLWLIGFGLLALGLVMVLVDRSLVEFGIPIGLAGLGIIGTGLRAHLRRVDLTPMERSVNVTDRSLIIDFGLTKDEVQIWFDDIESMHHYLHSKTNDTILYLKDGAVPEGKQMYVIHALGRKKLVEVSNEHNVPLYLSNDLFEQGELGKPIATYIFLRPDNHNQAIMSLDEWESAVSANAKLLKLGKDEILNDPSYPGADIIQYALDTPLGPRQLTFVEDSISALMPEGEEPKALEALAQSLGLVVKPMD